MKAINYNERILIIILLLFISINIAGCSKNPISNTSNSPGLHHGLLDNGFSYYLKNIPGKDIVIELNIHAGILQEGPDQYSMAHFLEHLAFLETENSKSINEQLDVTGGTRLNLTTFQFIVDRKDSEGLNTGLLFYKDLIAGKLKFNHVGVNEERKRIYEEILFRDGGHFYFIDKFNSDFSDCLISPIHPRDYKAYFHSFDVENVINFYKKWYHPGNTTISIVGDIGDTAVMEEKLLEVFGSIPQTGSFTKSQSCNTDYISRPQQFQVYKDTDTSRKALGRHITYNFLFRDKPKQSSREKERYHIGRSILLSILNEKLREPSGYYNSSFKAYSSHQYFPDALKITIKSEKESENALLETFEIYYSLRKFGLNEKQWIDTKSKFIEHLMSVDKTRPSYWIDGIRTLISEENVILDEENRIAKWLENLALNDFNELIKEILPEEPQDIAIVHPEEYLFTSTHKELRALLENAKEIVKPYQEKKTPVHLVSPEEVKKMLLLNVSKEGVDETGAQIFTLANGIRLVLKQLENSSENKILIHGFSDKGAECFPESDYFSAIMSPEIASNGGVKSYDKFELQRFLKKTNIPFGVQTYIYKNETGVKGASSTEDLEILLQLIYLNFTAPRFSPAAFEDWKKQEKITFAEHSDIFNADLNTHINALWGINDSNPKGTLRYEGSQKTDLTRASSIYKELFGNPKNFTFIINGQFSLDETLLLANKYLGNISATPQDNCKKKEEINDFTEVPRKLIFPSQEMKNSQPTIKYIQKTNNQDDWKETIKLNILSTIYSDQFNKYLRFEKKRAVYFANTVNYVDKDKELNIFTITLRCATEQTDAILKDIENMNGLLKTRIPEDVFEKVMRERIFPRYQTSKINSNTKMQQLLYDKYRYNIYVTQEDILGFLKSITVDDIQNTAKDYLNDEYKFTFIATSS